MEPSATGVAAEMISVIAMVVVAVAFAWVLLALVRGGGWGLQAVEDPLQHLQPVHVPAMLNLLDPEQQEYLRGHVSAREFRMLERKRTRVLLVYVGRIAKNARLLAQFAHGAVHSTDTEVSRAGQALLDSALRTRVAALRAMAGLYFGLVFPAATAGVQKVLERYESARTRYELLGRNVHGVASRSL